MNNFVVNSINSRTPVKRIGLSRKRKSLSTCSDNVEKNTVKDCCDKKIMKKDKEQIKAMESEEKCKMLGSVMSSTSGEENVLKYPKLIKDKIMEVENLYSIWKDGYKKAFLYLLNLIKTMHSETDVDKILKELGVPNVISTHFKNDSDLEFCSYSSDDLM